MWRALDMSYNWIGGIMLGNHGGVNRYVAIAEEITQS